MKRKKRKKKNLPIEDLNYNDSDEYFYFIAGYTSGDVPYGITWEQAREEGLIEEEEFDDENDWELPF